MNVENLIKTIKITEKTRCITCMLNIYDHLCHLQHITYLCSLDNINEKENIEIIITDINKYGYKMENCNNYNTLIIEIEKLKLSIKIQINKYIKKEIKDKALEEMFRKVFNI